MRIYTRRGDDGSTGLLHGGRVDKDGAGPEAFGAVDEAVSALGVARSLADEDTAAGILRLQREMFVVGAELATAPENRSRLTDGVSRVTPAMVEALERAIDAVAEEAGVPGEFVVPGGTPASAALDHARSVIRRAERRAVALGRETEVEDSHVIPYLNRSADYVYMLARAVEAVWTPTREE